MFPILNPPPSSLPIPSLWVVPVHQPQASSIVHRTWTGNSFHTTFTFICSIIYRKEKTRTKIVLNRFSHVHFYSMDCSLPGSSVHGILHARILEWVAMPPPGDLPDPGIEPVSLMSPALAGRFFNTSTIWEAQLLHSYCKSF